eukprot:TRINITY_DN101903_c0_g1_i1.p1 TRINITY_DN101903_c0_g1~~TRINITY_DN101903_c0_g1_i1.p1  ORF type:complete len:737 (+),score=221.49 TRINITY_DN101903_c0_g1_i1:161-2371(+)
MVRATSGGRPTARERSRSPGSDDDPFVVQDFTHAGKALLAVEKTHRMFMFTCAHLLETAETREETFLEGHQEVREDSGRAEKALARRKAEIGDATARRAQRLQRVRENQMLLQESEVFKSTHDKQQKETREQYRQEKMQEREERHEKRKQHRLLVAEDRKERANLKTTDDLDRLEEARLLKEQRDLEKAERLARERQAQLELRSLKEQENQRQRVERVKIADNDRSVRIVARRNRRNDRAGYLQGVQAATQEYVASMQKQLSAQVEDLRRLHKAAEKHGDLTEVRAAVQAAFTSVPQLPVFVPPERKATPRRHADDSYEAEAAELQPWQSPAGGARTPGAGTGGPTAEGNTTSVEALLATSKQHDSSTCEVMELRKKFQRMEFRARAEGVLKLLDKMDALPYWQFVRELRAHLKEMELDAGQLRSNKAAANAPLRAAAVPGSVLHLELQAAASALRDSIVAFKEPMRFEVLLEETNTLLDSLSTGTSPGTSPSKGQGLRPATAPLMMTSVPSLRVGPPRDSADVESPAATTATSLSSSSKSPRWRPKATSIEMAHQAAWQICESPPRPLPQASHVCKQPTNGDKEYRLYEAMFASPQRGRSAPCGRHVVASMRLAGLRGGVRPLLKKASTGEDGDGLEDEDDEEDFVAAGNASEWTPLGESAFESLADITGSMSSPQRVARTNSGAVHFSKSIEVFELGDLGEQPPLRPSNEYTPGNPPPNVPPRVLAMPRTLDDY